MSLRAQIEALAVRIGTEFKTIRTLISGTATGNISGLATTDKTSLVAAINEVNSAATAAVNTDGVAEGTTNLYFTQARVRSTPITGFTSGAGVVAPTDTVLQALQKINGNVAAIDLTALINDAAPSTTTTYSGTKISADIAAAVAAVVAASPAALDTLNELATALGNDANFSTTVTTALGNRVRFDAAQTLSAGQQDQATQNLGMGALSTLNLVATFEAALV